LSEFEEEAVTVTVVPETLHAPAMAVVPCTVARQPGVLEKAAVNVIVQLVLALIVHVPANVPVAP
jgi:hypothetical protein